MCDNRYDPRKKGASTRATTITATQALTAGESVRTTSSA